MHYRAYCERTQTEFTDYDLSHDTLAFCHMTGKTSKCRMCEHFRKEQLTAEVMTS